MGITQELAGYCSRMTFNDLSDEVIDCAKYRFLDFISVACRGSIENPSQSMYRFVKEMEKGEGVIIGTREKAPYLYSALANGTSSHAIEMDDVHNESSLHPGVEEDEGEDEPGAGGDARDGAGPGEGEAEGEDAQPCKGCLKQAQFDRAANNLRRRSAPVAQIRT